MKAKTEMRWLGFLNRAGVTKSRTVAGGVGVRFLVTVAVLVASALMVGGYFRLWPGSADALARADAAAVMSALPPVDVSLSSEVAPRTVGVARALRTWSTSVNAAADTRFAANVPETQHALPPMPMDGAEHPLFAALRAGAGQPIPAEVVALAQQITEGCTNDLQRASALYRWLTETIRYDVAEWEHIVGGGDDYSHDHDPLSVLQRGTTVCIGYSWLFNALAQSVGLQANYLIGDVRGYRGTADDAVISAFKHAWNGVRVEGEWLLLDATWGARQTDETDDAYAARNAYYFATPANQMIFDHLPESPDWQLLADPVPDEAAFRALPNLKPAFFRDGLRLLNAATDTVRLDAGARGRVSLAAPEDVGIVATLTDAAGGTVQLPIAVADAGRHDVAVGPLHAGSYILRVYSAPHGPDVRYECAVDYVVTVP